MPPNRLPIVDSDDGVWGDILRQYLMKEHTNDDTDNAANGGHKTITITAGTASAGTAPLKFTSGTLLSSPEVGAVEFVGDNLYVTQTSGTTRKKVALYDDSSGATGDIYYRNGTGYFTRLAAGSDGDILTLSSGTPSWSTPATVAGTGMLEPVQAHTNGAENYTISAGTVTQIAGTSIHGGTYSPAVGDRILIATAPATSGTGTTNTLTTQPANGIYTVTNNSTNLSVSRASDLSGSEHPAGMRVYSAAPALSWRQNAVWTITTPQGPGSFTYGTNNIAFTTPRTTTDFVVINNSTNSINISNGTGNTAIQPTASSGTQTLTLPATTTSDTLVGRASTDTLTNKTLTDPKANAIYDTAGDIMLDFTGYGTRVNYFRMWNKPTGDWPELQAMGSDTDVGIFFTPKGDGPVSIWAETASEGKLRVQGVANDLDLNLIPKGTGRAKINSVDIPTVSSTDTLTNKTLTSPRIDSDILDENGNEILGLSSTPGATRWAYITNSDNGWHPFLNVEGAGTDIDLGFAPKGAGRLYSFQPAGGTTEFYFDGSTSDVNLNLATKGNGVVMANGVEVATKNDIVHSPTAIWGDGILSSSIQVGHVTYVRVPYSGTITEWHIIANASTTCTLDIWKDTTLPTNADSITASAKPSLTTATTASSSTLTGWTTAVSAGDIFGFELEALSAGTPSEITLTLRIE